MSLLEHAEQELNIIGMTDESDHYRKHILHMVNEFAVEHHSGFTASFTIGMLEKLLKFLPLSPLTGDDSEWNDVSQYSNGVLYQNNRCSRIFKDENGAYDVEGKVFWEWSEREYEEGEEGYPGTYKFKSYYTNGDSRTLVTFPYIPNTEYIEIV